MSNISERDPNTAVARMIQSAAALAGQVQAKHGLVVHVQAAGTIEVRSDALRAFLYRAALETLFNVVKHAGVKEAQVRVRRLGPYVGLSVLDRGHGFDPQDLKATAGFVKGSPKRQPGEVV